MVMGVITKDLDDAVLNRQFVESGFGRIGLMSGFPTIFRLTIGDFLPFTFTLSGFLKENRTNVVSSNMLESGEIVIMLSFRWKAEKNRWLALTTEVQFDPASCVVTKQRVYYTNFDSVREFSETMPSFVTYNGKKALDRIIFRHTISDRIIDEVEIQFENFEINPPVDASVFQLEFPEGVHVEDYVDKKYYKVDDPMDEEKAVYEFMQRHGFTGNITLPKRQMVLWQYILMGIGIVMILIALYGMLMKRIKGQ